MLGHTPAWESAVLDPPRRRGRLRGVVLLVTLASVAAGLAYLSVVAPAMGSRVISLLPEPLAEPARAGLDSIVLFSAPRRDGLKWVDVGDPRLRRGDKLSTKAP